jgi:hypothetical protein
MFTPPRLLATLALFCLFAPDLPAAQDSDAVNSTRSYAEMKVEARPWPKARPMPLSFSTRWKSAPETGPYQEFYIAGDGLGIKMQSLGSFVYDDAAPTNADWPGSVVLYDSRAPSGMLFFTRFAAGDFAPQVDEGLLLGYAKALAGLTSSEKGITVEIVIPPSALERKQALLQSKPVFITWRMSDRNTGMEFQRTDYFLNLDDGSLLVASVVATPVEERAVRRAACELLRFAYIEDKDDSLPK